MKRSISLSSISLLLVVSILSTGCPGSGGDSKKDNPTPTCVAQPSAELSSINVFDGNFLSPYYNIAIANFKLSQAFNTYVNNCQQNDYGVTSLKITNAINRTISFNYLITATIGLVTWQYQDVATIPANTTIDVGVINSNVQRLHIGTVIILLNNITYN